MFSPPSLPDEDHIYRVERLHFYPFGGLAGTARWIEAIHAGAFTLHDDGLGFTVDAPGA